MSSINIDLAKALNRIQRAGSYYTTGAVEILAPRLEVDGVGPIALPLLPVQARQLIAVAEQAPYGKGPETLVDTQVRNTWQIDATQVQIGRRWEQTVTDIVKSARAGLGVTGSVTAEFYKMLVYEPGQFFLSHRDTEKAPGMFATLIIVLPSIYTGGELVVRHQGEEAVLDLCPPEPAIATFAAFYADCLHEVRPVTSGCRLALVYNLLRPDRSRLPEPPNHDAEQALLTKLLRQWSTAKQSPDDESPEKLIYPLEHVYTEAEISFDMLKGADIARADALIAAAGQAECDLHLALVSIEESGNAEYHGDYYGSRRRKWSYDEDDEDEDEDEGDFEIGEVFDRDATLSQWQRPDGQPATLGNFPFEEEELCPPGALDNMEPDETHFQEASGNAGASFDRTYRRAALVVWPQHRRLAVFNQAGLGTTLPYLTDLAQQWSQSGQSQASPLWQQAHKLTGFMLETWEIYRPSSPHPQAVKLLTTLTQLKDTVHIEAFLTNISAAGNYHKDDNAAILKASSLLPPIKALELIWRIIAGNAAESRSACADLLARSAMAAQKTGQTADLIPIAKILLNTLPGDPARIPPPPPEQRWRAPPPRVESTFVVDLLTGLGLIDPNLADQAVRYMLAWPDTYPLDGILIPAALDLVKKPDIRPLAAFERLRAACLVPLRQRIAEPLEPPSDWTRPSTVSCKCAHCAELSRFLADPKRKVWDFRSPQPNRDHVSNVIRQNQCDLDCGTDKQGRPYGLVCTKNQASYERRVAQRKKDLADQQRFG